MRAWSSTGLIAAVLAPLSLAAMAAADPPHKPKHSTPARTLHAAPDVTSTIATPDRAKTPETAPVEDISIPLPFNLPAASRPRVRACGAKWRDMKLNGTTGDEDWRDFAMRCFVEDSRKAGAD